jgi:hypothetical protein
MQATRATEQSQDSRSQSSQHQDSQHQDSRSQSSRHQDSQRDFTALDKRYGEIGISAVAGAVRHKGEQRKPNQSRFIPHDSD